MAFGFYVTKHHGRHDLVRKKKLAIKTLYAVSVTYFFSAPSRSLGVYIVGTMYVL